MNTGDSPSSTSQGNTKSTILALLRNREQRPITRQSIVPSDSTKDNNVLTKLGFESEFSDFGIVSEKLESDIIAQPSQEHLNNSNQQDNLEYQKDFSYSQKLFHIADGNLYSIFSPIQGRSYGMKPSFLRKQKYTVQECHGRGRKNLRKGLKFHNFLPSESVTSEKDSGYLNTKWKVHSECRLREEHGTKQITISNWSQSIQNPPTESNSSGNSFPSATSTSETISKSPIKEEDDGLEYKSSTNDPYDFNLCLQPSSPESTNVPSDINQIRSEVIQNISPSTSKKDSLSLVLNSLREKPLLAEKKAEYSDEIDMQSKSFHKHRRKPMQTRRVVPYMKYLSIMEENESLPLDLSSKCLIDNSSNHGSSSGDESYNTSGKNDVDTMNSMACDKNASSDFVPTGDSLQLSNLSKEKMDGVMSSQIAAPVAVLYPSPFNKSSNLGQNGFHPMTVQGPSKLSVEMNTNQNVNIVPSVSIDKSILANQHFTNNFAFSVQKSFVKEIQSKPRRRNQRSVMKQKLEDTFRQNGFLVKTKQVSDGEATFCKFRQLRKYTRYYLKSLEQHLPDEFHKMWKGFLPPKTVLPPVLGAPESSKDNL